MPTSIEEYVREKIKEKALEELLDKVKIVTDTDYIKIVKPKEDDIVLVAKILEDFFEIYDKDIKRIDLMGWDISDLKIRSALYTTAWFELPNGRLYDVRYSIERTSSLTKDEYERLMKRVEALKKAIEDKVVKLKIENFDKIVSSLASENYELRKELVIAREKIKELERKIKEATSALKEEEEEEEDP